MQMAPSVATGAAVVYENRNLLNIPVELPDSLPSPMRRRPPVGERGKSYSSADIGIRRAEHSRHQSSGSMGLPEILARGLLDRGESLGINKTVMNAVSELKRNLPDLSSSFIHPQSQPSTYQLVNERPSEERPRWEPRSRFELEREIVEIKLLQRKLGDSVERIVDALLQDEDTADHDKVMSIKDKKREALEALAHVRDVLKGRTTMVDENQFFEAEELSTRRDRLKESVAPDEAQKTRRKITPTPLTPSTTDQRIRMAKTSNSQESLPVPSFNNTTLSSVNDTKSNMATISQCRVSSSSTPGASSTYPPPAPRRVQQDPLGAVSHYNV